MVIRGPKITRDRRQPGLYTVEVNWDFEGKPRKASVSGVPTRQVLNVFERMYERVEGNPRAEFSELED